jgi:hypothetical protein
LLTVKERPEALGAPTASIIENAAALFVQFGMDDSVWGFESWCGEFAFARNRKAALTLFRANPSPHCELAFSV